MNIRYCNPFAPPTVILLIFFAAWANVGMAEESSEPAEIIGKTETEMAHLIYTIERGEHRERLDAIQRLGELGPSAAVATATLIKTLPDPGEYIREASIDTLGKIGPEAMDAVPALKKYLAPTGRYKGVRAQAMQAYWRITKERDEVFKVIKSILEGSSNRYDRNIALHTLGELGPTVPGAVPLLLKSLKADGFENRSAAAEALGRMGPAAKVALPELIKALEGEKFLIFWSEVDSWICATTTPLEVAAARALGKLGADAKEALPRLAHYGLRAPDEDFRKEAAKAFFAIQAALEKR